MAILLDLFYLLLAAASLVYYTTVLTKAPFLETGSQSNSLDLFCASSTKALSRLLFRSGLLDETERRTACSAGYICIFGGGFLGLVFGLFTPEMPSAMLCGLVGIQLGAGTFVGSSILFQRSYHYDLLSDVAVFGQQLLMISVAGDPFEEGIRKIVDVSLRRNRLGAIEELVVRGLAERARYPSLADALVHLATLVECYEFKRALQIKLESDRYGSAVAKNLRDLAESARIRSIRVVYFRAPKVPRLAKRYHQKAIKDLFHFLLSFSNLLKTNRDILSSLRTAAEVADEDSIMKHALQEMFEETASGTSEQDAIAQLGAHSRLRPVDLLVQALLLSNLAPRKLSEMLELQLLFLKDEMRNA